MSFDVKYSPVFERAIKRLAKKYPSVRGDLELLITELAEDPHIGTALGQDCYKVRMAIRSKGKGRSGRTPPERFGDGARSAGDHLCEGGEDHGHPAHGLRQVRDGYDQRQGTGQASGVDRLKTYALMDLIFSLMQSVLGRSRSADVLPLNV